MEGFFGPRLLRGAEEVPTASLAGRVVGLYFSAHWCPPCQQYTPLLKKVYERAKAKGKSFDIVFVSSDRDEASFRQYFGTMPWHALPYSNRVAQQALSQAFQIRGIPSLVLVTGTGSLLDPNAKAKAMMPGFLATLPREIDVKDVGPLPTDAVEVAVRYQGQEYTVECEPEEGWEVLRMLVFSVTEVPAEKQRLFGLGVPCGPLDDSVPLPRAIAGGLAAQRGSGLQICGVADAQRTASSSWGDDAPGCGNHRGRLDSGHGWICKAEDQHPWYQMDLGEKRQVAGVALAPRVDCAHWVTRFKVLCAEDAAGPWQAVEGGREFEGCSAWLQEAPTRLLFAAPVATRFVRLQPTAHHHSPSLRADVLLAPADGTPAPDRPPTVVVLGNFSADDPFEVQQADAAAMDRLMEEQHLALLQAKLSSLPPRLQSQVGSLDHVRKYEDRPLQRQALDDIPVVGMDAAASEACGKEGYELAFMRQLLRWFKHDFFVWTNAPRCEHCGSGDTRTVGATGPTDVERQFGAGSVEVAECKSCGLQTRFPRYNDPSKLLETRNGRCGEWANCFTLVCRALGYEARHVHDWTDHVWTEVYSDSLRRWVHADSCEAALDTPLVYEQGWGKKLTYVIGFARDHVLDVTKRYTRKFDELLTRRKEFTEAQLKQAMRAVGDFATDRSVAELPQGAGEARRAALERRAELEAQELEGGAPKVEVKAEEQVGRTSGDAQWREQRGELGSSAAAKAQALELSEQGLAGAATAAAAAEPAAAAPAAASAKAAAVAPGAASAEPGGKQPEPPQPAAAQPPEAKQDAQAAFKARFAAHVAAGLPPNEAAVRALQETKQAAAPAFNPPPRGS